MPEAGRAKLNNIVREWFGRALSCVRTKNWSTSWSDFTIAWSNVKWAVGQSFKMAAAAADRAPIPPIAEQLGYEGYLLRLTSLCWQLQLQAGSRPFPLGCREAGEFLGVSKSEANRLLRTLEFDGVLRLVKKGTKASKKANEWRFITGK